VADDLLLLIISSPSGAGKTTLTRDLLEHFPGFMFSVSHTTRKPRANEVDGRDYHFIDAATFRRLIAENAFAEWAEVHGNLYGTALSEIARGKQLGRRGIVFDIDYQGARQIKARCPDAVAVFVLPPSMDALKQRLRTRAADDDATIERRYGNAKREIEHYLLFDYVIVNDDLEHAKERLRSIVVAEWSRRERMSMAAEELLRSARDS
jgi:guanylate kinase